MTDVGRRRFLGLAAVTLLAALGLGCVAPVRSSPVERAERRRRYREHRRERRCCRRRCRHRRHHR